MERRGTDPESAGRELAGRVDYVYTWGMPFGDPLAQSLGKHFARISDRDGGVLWEARSRLQP